MDDCYDGRLILLHLLFYGEIFKINAVTIRALVRRINGRNIRALTKTIQRLFQG
jgi:hypothetical protein